jgi:hypothetical protein
MSATSFSTYPLKPAISLRGMRNPMGPSWPPSLRIENSVGRPRRSYPFQAPARRRRNCTRSLRSGWRDRRRARAPRSPRRGGPRSRATRRRSYPRRSSRTAAPSPPPRGQEDVPRFVPAGPRANVISEIDTCLRLIECEKDSARWEDADFEFGVYYAWERARESIFAGRSKETNPANLQPIRIVRAGGSGPHNDRTAAPIRAPGSQTPVSF